MLSPRTDSGVVSGMARIEHVALWTGDVGRLRDFYVRFFGARAGDHYSNPAHAFESCFLEFDGGRGAQAGTKVRPSLQRSSLTSIP